MHESKGLIWTGRILSTLAILFMAMDGIMKLFRPAFVIQASAKIGYAASTLPGIGVALLVCTLLYAIPRTSNLGVVLLTGYFGGAVASQVRIGASTFNVIFPIVLAVILWASLWLRDPRARPLLTPYVSRT